MNKPAWLQYAAEETRAEWTNVSPDEVLYEYDGPRIFITRDAGWTYLWYLCEMRDASQVFIVVNTSQGILDRLSNGVITVLEALSVPGLRVVELDYEYNVLRHWRSDIGSVEQNRLPKPHVMLFPSLEPALSLKLTGNALAVGQVPVSAIKRGIDGAYLALKKLAEAAAQIGAVGRPPKETRRLFDLPTQRLAFGSIEIAFSARPGQKDQLIPDEGTQAGIANMGALLSGGLDWLEDTRGNDTAPGLEVLEALAQLSPRSDSPVERVEVRGTLLRRRKEFVLTKTSTKRIRAEIKKKREDSVDVDGFVGIIREFDKDKMSFILRNTRGENVAYFTFDDEDYDDAYEAFSDGLQVQVYGQRARGQTAHELILITPDKSSDQPE